MSLYTSPAAADGLRAWYPRFLAKIGTPMSERTVPTRFGDTHVLVGGPEGAPPLLVLHGVMATSAHVMVEVEALLSRFRVYAPDVLGHSPMSADARPPLDGYAGWATDVLDGLGLGTVPVVGVSYGGFVALQLAKAAPNRVSRLSLLVPGGLVNGPAFAGMMRLALPMTLYRWFPTEARLRTFTEGLFTTWDDDWAHWLGDAVRGFTMDLRVPPLATREQLAGYTGPVQVFGAKLDLSFPGEPLIARAREVFAGNVEGELIVDARHAPAFTPEFRAWLAGRMIPFLEGRVAG